MWHWSNISDALLQACGFMTSTNAQRLKRLDSTGVREYGLDGIALDENGVYHGIQAKCWTATLCAHHLGTFFSVTHGRFKACNDASCGYLYHTTQLQSDLREDLALMTNIRHMHLPWSPEESDVPYDLPLRAPQRDALAAIRQHFSQQTGIPGTDSTDDTPDTDSTADTPDTDSTSEDLSNASTSLQTASLVQLPCGVGKTALAGHYLRETQPDCIILVSPLRAHAKQMLKRITEFLPHYDLLLVDSDIGATSAHVVTQPTRKTLISTTYESVAFLKHLDAFLVIDEAHHLQGDLCDWVCDKRALLMTATPPVLLTQSVNVVFEYSMREAIDDEFICDYEVRLPVDEEILIPACLNANDMTSCALFLISGMLETGASKCIIYCSSIDECTSMTKTVTDICKTYHGLEYSAGTITAKTGSAQRDAILEEFSTTLSRVAVIASVRILNEAIDIPRCDSVCFTRTTCSETTAIQRMCRANRINPSNPNKVAQVFVFSPFDDCAGMLASLKHCDPSFETRIRMVSANYDQKDTREVKVKAAEQREWTMQQVKIKSATVEDVWDARLAEAHAFITQHGRRPNSKVEGEKLLAQWMYHQTQCYKEKRAIMRITCIREKWQVFMHAHPCIATPKMRWRSNKAALVNFWKEKKRNPARKGEDKELGLWLKNQKRDYKKHQYIMTDPEFRKEWEQAMLQFTQFCLSDEEAFAEKCTQFKSFVLEHNRRPKETKGFKDEKTLHSWFGNTNKAYKAKTRQMAKDDFRKMFEQLIADLNVLQ